LHKCNEFLVDQLHERQGHERALHKAGFDLSQLNTNAVHFHLVIFAAQDFQLSFLSSS